MNLCTTNPEDPVFNGCESRSTCKWKRKLIQKKTTLKIWRICVSNSLRNHSPIRDELGQGITESKETENV